MNGHMLDTIQNKCVHVGVIRPQDMVPAVHILSLFVLDDTMTNTFALDAVKHVW